MATTINSAFERLKENLEITGLQESTVSIRQNRVRDVMKDGMTVVNTFLTGSYSRNTLIAPLSEADVDIFVILDPKYFYHYNNNQNGGQAGLLDLVKKTLRRTYTKTPDISRNGQAVTIRFDDFMVDVVPAFDRKGGGYLIPNSISQSWISTDPKKHVEIMSQQNKIHQGKLVPLVKMIKGWNKINGKFFQSFHLEVLTIQILNGVTINDYPSGIRFFFDKARNLITSPILDPAGYGGNIGSYINTTTKINDAISKLQLAYERSIKAEYEEIKYDTRSSIDYWRKIFGGYFPAYG